MEAVWERGRITLIIDVFWKDAHVRGQDGWGDLL